VKLPHVACLICFVAVVEVCCKREVVVAGTQTWCLALPAWQRCHALERGTLSYPLGPHTAAFSCRLSSLPRCVQAFKRLWSDDSGATGLTIWHPEAPPGYCSLGAVATTDSRPPPPMSAFCVRHDAALLSQSPPLVAVQISVGNNDFHSQPSTAMSISLCVYDMATQAMQLRRPSTQAQPCFVLSLPTAAVPGDAAPAVTLHLGTGSVCVRVRNILRVPLLELETAGIDAECEACCDGSTRATVNFSPEAWSYNAAIKEWEPMVEKFPVRVRLRDHFVGATGAPSGLAGGSALCSALYRYLRGTHTGPTPTQSVPSCAPLAPSSNLSRGLTTAQSFGNAPCVQVKYQSNPHSLSVDGTEPGTTLTITSHEAVHATLSHAAVDSLLRALAWWRNAASTSYDQSALYRHAAAADAAVVLTEVHNTTGELLQMWMDLGDKTRVTEVATGVQSLMQPLVRPVPRSAGTAKLVRLRLPAMVLCVTLKALQLEVRLLSCCLRPVRWHACHRPKWNAQEASCKVSRRPPRRRQTSQVPSFLPQVLRSPRVFGPS
jgi:hypothetical protein